MLWFVNKFSQLSFFYQSAEFVYVGNKWRHFLLIIIIIFLNYEYRLFMYCLFPILLAWLSHDPYITSFMCGIFIRCPSCYGKQIFGCLESKWPALNFFEMKIKMVNPGKK